MGHFTSGSSSFLVGYGSPKIISLPEVDTFHEGRALDFPSGKVHS